MARFARTKKRFLDNTNFFLHNEQVNPLLDVHIFDKETSESDFLRILTYCDTYYWDNDELPSLNHLIYEFDVKREWLLDQEERLSTALVARGLPPVEFSPPKTVKRTRKSGETDLDPLFVAAVNLVCDTVDKRALSKKLQTVNLSSKDWSRLLSNPKHQAYFKKRVDKAFGMTSQAARLALAKNVEAGDLQSIKYYMELTGEYRPNQQTLLNLGQLIGRLMEVLPRFLNPDQMMQVADEFERVLAIETTGRELNADSSS